MANAANRWVTACDRATRNAPERDDRHDDYYHFNISTIHRAFYLVGYGCMYFEYDTDLCHYITRSRNPTARSNATKQHVVTDFMCLLHAHGSNDVSIKTCATITIRSLLNCPVLSTRPPSIVSVLSEKEPKDFSTEMFPPGFFVVHDTPGRRQHQKPGQTFQTH